MTARGLHDQETRTRPRCLRPTGAGDSHRTTLSCRNVGMSKNGARRRTASGGIGGSPRLHGQPSGIDARERALSARPPTPLAMGKNACPWLQPDLGHVASTRQARAGPCCQRGYSTHLISPGRAPKSGVSAFVGVSIQVGDRAARRGRKAPWDLRAALTGTKRLRPGRADRSRRGGQAGGEREGGSAVGGASLTLCQAGPAMRCRVTRPAGCLEQPRTTAIVN